MDFGTNGKCVKVSLNPLYSGNPYSPGFALFIFSNPGVIHSVPIAFMNAVGTK